MQNLQMMIVTVGWRGALHNLLTRRRRLSPTMFQRCLALHIASAGARTALS